MEKNSKNKHQSTVITLNFNDNNYQFSTELAKPIETFYSEICAYLQINPKNFLLYYNSNFISFKSNPNQKIFDIIDNNPNSIFKIVPKKTKTINLRYQTIDQADNNKNNNNNINSRNRYNELSFSSKSVRSNLKHWSNNNEISFG